MRFNALPEWAKTVRPIFGSDGDGEGAGAGAGEGAGAGAGAGTGDGKPGAGGDGKVTTNAEENKAPQLTQAQIEKLIQDNAAAQAEISAYQTEKQEREAAQEEAERATRSKEENLEKDVQRLSEENGQLKIVNERNLLDLAIFRNKSYQWIDEGDVAALLDRSGIKIDAAKGTITGIDEALKKLAKDKPHLLKQKENENNGGGNGGLGTGFQGGMPSGGTPSGGNDGSKATKRQQLENRFSVLKV